MLPVVHDVPVQLERRCASAQQAATLEKFHPAAGVFERGSGSQSRKTAADYRYAGISHDFMTTRNFSLRESAARSRSGNAGSRSIFCKMPS